MHKELLEWRFEDDETPPLFATPPAPKRASVWRTVLFLLALPVVLSVAAFSGYVLGRYQRVQTLARADLQAIVDLETWAWQAGERGLFHSLLDPMAPLSWRRELEIAFEKEKGTPLQATVERLSLQGDVAKVVVRVVRGGQEWWETRFYRLVNDQWLRTSPPG